MLTAGMERAKGKGYPLSMLQLFQNHLIIMKKITRFFIRFLGVATVLLLAAAAWVQFSPLPTFETRSLELRIPSDSASLAHGRALAIGHCGHCHLGDDGRLSGRMFMRQQDAFGEIWSRNLTRHPEKGLGRYSDGELAWLMRTGVKRDGHMAGYFMSSLQVSDHDMACVIAFLRSNDPIVAPSESDPPHPQYSFLAKALIKLGAFKPLPYDGAPVTEPPASDPIAYGKYLATGRYECYGCHSKSFETNDPVHPEKSEGYFAGGNPVLDANFNEVPSANITPSVLYGIGSWTEAQFSQALRGGLRPDQRALSPVMPRFANMSDEEVSAIWAYLQSVPVTDKQVIMATR